jgi:hypothetical protein
MPRVAAVLLPLAVLALLLAAPPAIADDASVKRAWDSEDAAFTSLGKSVRREQARWERRGFTRDGKLLRLMRRGERLSRTVVERVTAEQPSSPTGAEARERALRSTSTFAEFFVAERRFIRAMRPRPSRRARRLERRAISLDRRTRREAKRALELFKQLGLA